MDHTADRHRLSFSRTTSGGVVPLCSCGWIGRVHKYPIADMAAELLELPLTDTNAMFAAKEHREHVTVDGPLSIPGVPPSAVAALRNRSRFPHA